MPDDWSPPGMYFYWSDFFDDSKVELMTNEMIGVYMRLMGKAWKERPRCTLPDDDEVLATWARMTTPAWKKIRARVLAPWTPTSDGRLIQKRMKKEWDAQHERHRQAMENGRRGNEKRWGGDRVATQESSGGDRNPIASLVPSPSLVPPKETKEEKKEGTTPSGSGALGGGTTTGGNGKGTGYVNRRAFPEMRGRKGHHLVPTLARAFWTGYNGKLSPFTIVDEIEAEMRSNRPFQEILAAIEANRDPEAHIRDVLRGKAKGAGA